MKILTEKLDYDLFEKMFIEQDLEGAHALWQNVCKNSAFLREAMQIEDVKDGMCPTFRAPMICFMILKFPNSVTKELYEKLVDLVIRRRDVASSINIGDNYLDFLSMILMNSDVKLNDYQKSLIINLVQDNYGINEDKKAVSYDELLDIESPLVVKFSGNGLEISVSEYEYESLQKGEVKKARNIRRYKDGNDYRKKIVTNPNFSELEKKYVAERIEQDEQEFRQFINYYLNQIMMKNSLEELTPEYLRETDISEIKTNFGDNSDLITDLLFVKGLLDRHYREEISLVRKVN